MLLNIYSKEISCKCIALILSHTFVNQRQKKKTEYNYRLNISNNTKKKDKRVVLRKGSNSCFTSCARHKFFSLFWAFNNTGCGLWVMCVYIHVSTIVQLCGDSQFYWWRKLWYPKKTINLLTMTDKLHHIKLYRVDLDRGGKITIGCILHHISLHI
jgi:hypothetical protein